MFNNPCVQAGSLPGIQSYLLEESLLFPQCWNVLFLYMRPKGAMEDYGNISINNYSQCIELGQLYFDPLFHGWREILIKTRDTQHLVHHSGLFSGALFRPLEFFSTTLPRYSLLCYIIMELKVEGNLKPCLNQCWKVNDFVTTQCSKSLHT